MAGRPRDPGISSIFYYFEENTTLASGRTVGRKIGVVQEIILRRYLEMSEPLRRRMFLEQLLTGRSGASHKVEFSWYSVSSASVRPGDQIPGTDGLLVSKVDETRGTVTVAYRARSSGRVGPNGTPRTGKFREFLDQREIDLRIWSFSGDGAVVDVIDRSRLLASLESKRVGAQRFSGSSKLGSGIQTIEKAKQASLVAIDLDLAYNGSVKPLQAPGQRKELISTVALGNGVHWTKKDLQVLGTYVDFTFLVKDDAIIRYADHVRAEASDAGEPFMEFFMDYFVGMTKQPPDAFVATDSDFEIIAPATEKRSLRSVLEDHIVAIDA